MALKQVKGERLKGKGKFHPLNLSPFPLHSFLVLSAPWPHADPFPNSDVKRGSGDDTLGVAPRENSTVPGLLFKSKALFNQY